MLIVGLFCTLNSPPHSEMIVRYNKVSGRGPSNMSNSDIYIDFSFVKVDPHTTY